MSAATVDRPLVGQTVLAYSGERLIITGRDPDTGEQAATRIRQESGLSAGTARGGEPGASPAVPHDILNERMGSMKITYRAVLPRPPEEAFAFGADPATWSLFFPGVRAVTKDDDWGRVGSHARLISSVLGRSLTMSLELTE